MQNLKNKTKNSLLWSAIERFFTQTFQLSITLILARILGPSAFGLVGMLAVFIAIANVLIDSGFSSALIRKKDHCDDDLVTAFYYNILMSGVCYLIIFFIAPYVAVFYHQPELEYILRLLGIIILINSFMFIPKLKLTLAMDFKTQAKISIISVSIGGVLAIIMAVLGYGVWSLVCQMILSAVCSVILFNLFFPWIPNGKITKISFNYLFGFGSKLLISSLLDVVYNNLYLIIIGKKFSPAIVGQFTQANQLASVPAMTLTGIIQRVTYPMFSHIQDKTDKLEDLFFLTLKMAAVFIFPLVIGIAIIARPMLTLVLGVQWQDAANLLSILCIGYMLYPIHAINLNLLQVKGRSDLFLKLEVIKKIIGITILFITIPFGLLAMCIGFCITSYASLFLNTYYTSKLTKISQWQQCKKLLPIWLASVSSALIGYALGLYVYNIAWLQIMTTLFFSLLFYIIYLIVFQKKLTQNLLSMLRG
ncbi:lipopolysaccharide biosynthesis protein [Serratia oryzae]|uniref:Lipopolysaccharide biosynthesis protein n=1 Tax=Serratia oryzae TaxID=2034155 RepID=A0A1S8CK96_9GAMM|nr:lipopolysaccharide biosynthesis protein [Serratia oryzae]OMQ23066.1 lipopolysaccharide biosynthesis protein [Serratia oryzae]